MNEIKSQIESKCSLQWAYCIARFARKMTTSYVVVGLVSALLPKGAKEEGVTEEITKQQERGKLIRRVTNIGTLTLCQSIGDQYQQSIGRSLLKAKWTTRMSQKIFQGFSKNFLKDFSLPSHLDAPSKIERILLRILSCTRFEVKDERRIIFYAEKS